MTNAEETRRSFHLLEEALHDRKSGHLEVACDICGARLKSYLITEPEKEAWSDGNELKEWLGFVCGRGANRTVRQETTYEPPDGPFTVSVWSSKHTWTANGTCDNASWMVKKLLAERAEAQKTNQQPSTGHESR